MQFVAQLFSRSANKTGCRVRELRWKKIYQRDSAHGFLVRRGGIGIYIEETRRLFGVKPLFPERMLINVTQCLHSFHSSGSFFPLQLRHDYSTRYYCLINQECSHQIGNTGPTRPIFEIASWKETNLPLWSLHSICLNLITWSPTPPRVICVSCDVQRFSNSFVELIQYKHVLFLL